MKDRDAKRNIERNTERNTEHGFTCQDAVLLAQENGCSVWQFRNETGEGTMTAYDIFPGVMLSFNDFHMEYYDSGYAASRSLFAIDHCREGRMEYASGDNRVAYTEAGDMKLDLRQEHTGIFRFPSCHYHGLTIAFDRELAAKSLPEEIRDFPTDPERIIARWQLGRYPRVMHRAEILEHVFGEMYRVPEQIRIPYYKIKILELLLYLDAMSIPEADPEPPYFYKTQVETVRAIKSFLIEHITENVTQEELASRFNISLTTMKNCFRSVYGSAIGTWLTDYRMNWAAELLLRERETGIAEIGSRVGYENAAKFTAAFKRIMRMTPSEYRKERGRKHEN